MTVSELLDHFGFNPTSICYYDRDANVEDVADDEQYEEFFDKYGNRFVSNWFMNREYALRIIIE